MGFSRDSVESTVNLYLFDFDKTLYAYDFRKRLPALSRMSGVSQYHLAKTWWAGGYEARAELGEWPTAADYLDKFAEVTGARITLDQWREAPARGIHTQRRRRGCAAPGLDARNGVAVLEQSPRRSWRHSATMAPDVAAILGRNVLVSCEIGIRKPDPAAYLAAVKHYGAAATDTFFVDDSAANIAGAAADGITTFHYRDAAEVPALDAAIRAFAAR